MQRLQASWWYEQDLHTNADREGEVEQEEEGGHGWTANGEIDGGMNIKGDVELALSPQGTKPLGQFHLGEPERG